MHDPSTVAFEIRAPWFRRSKHFRSGRYHPSLVTIWHVDPETDGSDDSCDWFGRRLPEAAKELAQEMAEWDDKFPYYFTRPSAVRNQEYPSLRSISPGDCLAFVLAIYREAAWRLERRELSDRDMRRAMRAAVNPHDNFQESFTRKESTDDTRRVFALVIADYLRGRRPWWRHPRWHVWHWRIQIHGVQSFKRWAFSRCCKCGGRFRWGASVVGYQWHADGPRWFRGEPAVAHVQCDRAARKPAAAASALPSEQE